MTLKIVDNTFISACLGEIDCINLLEISRSNYIISTTSEVHSETIAGFEGNLVDYAYENISIHPIDNDNYLELKEWLEDRYPQIDSGEISTFLLALLKFALEDKAYYYITDDNKMKKTILKLNNDPIFMDKLGINFDMNQFNVTGTIGFIKRLIDKNLISKDYIEPIIRNLEENGFYLTDKIKDYLRG
ncbi:MAG: hypothetical protein CIT03_00570 [Methanobacterium sp.]|nr:MAG: hypothetical protein CIT03_00570 [Methanobacterium sp.]